MGSWAQRAGVGGLQKRKGGIPLSGKMVQMHLTQSSRSEEARGTDSAGGGENDRTFQKMGEAIASETLPWSQGIPRRREQVCGHRCRLAAGSGKGLRAGPLRRLVGVSGNARWARPARDVKGDPPR